MLEVSYLPYFPTPLGKAIDLTVNRLHLFNFWEYKDKYIEDPNVRQQLELLLSMYVELNIGALNQFSTTILDFVTDRKCNIIDENFQVELQIACNKLVEGVWVPLNQLTIAVIDNNYSFQSLEDDQRNDLVRYILALMYCGVIENEANAAWTSEHFRLYHQKFDIGQEMVSYTVGSYSRMMNMVDISEHKFLPPEYVVNSLFFRFDKKLFQAFANMIDAHNSNDEYLYQVLAWVRFSCSNNDEYSPELRLVALCTAFEVFFELPRSSKEDTFADKIETLLGVTEMPIYDCNFNIVQYGHPQITQETKDKRRKTNTIYGWWARDFYWVRSEIVHKGTLPEADFRNHNDVSQHALALQMLRFCLYCHLEKQGYLIYEKYDLSPEFDEASKWMSIKDLREVEKQIKLSMSTSM